MRFMICLRSMRTGMAKRKISVRWGTISSEGIGIGNSANTGSRAVDTGITSSRFDLWRSSSVDRSLDASISIKKAANNANST